MVAVLAHGELLGFGICVVGELKTFHGSSALLADVPDDVGDGIGLVPQVTVRDIDDAHLAVALAISETVGEAGFHFWSHVFTIDLAASVGS